MLAGAFPGFGRGRWRGGAGAFRGLALDFVWEGRGGMVGGGGGGCWAVCEVLYDDQGRRHRFGPVGGVRGAGGGCSSSHSSVRYRALRSKGVLADRASLKSWQCAGLLRPVGEVVSCAYRDVGTTPLTKLRLSPTCVVADHHWDTIVVKGGRQH